MNDVPPPPPPPYGSVPPGGGNPDVGPALSYGFSKYFSNLGPVLAVIFIPLVAQLVLTIFGQRRGRRTLRDSRLRDPVVGRRGDRRPAASTT